MGNPSVADIVMVEFVLILSLSTVTDYGRAALGAEKFSRKDILAKLILFLAPVPSLEDNFLTFSNIPLSMIGGYKFSPSYA